MRKVDPLTRAAQQAKIDPQALRDAKDAMEMRRNRVIVLYVMFIGGLWLSIWGTTLWIHWRVSAIEARTCPNHSTR